MNPAPHPALRHFNPDWYAWQNPDIGSAYASPYDHYVAIGRFENRDPSPMIDMRRYGQVVGETILPPDRLDAIQRGYRSVAMGVYDDWSDLQAAQRDFCDAIILTKGADRLRAPRRNLVFLQTGSQSCHRAWFDDTRDRNWDLLVNYYDARGFDPNFGDLVFFQAGTKFTAVHNLLTRLPKLLTRYDYALLLDDDILVSMDSLDALFQVCAENRLDLAQMALSDQSHCVWDALFARGRKGLRRLNCVEIMMPVLSRHALVHCGPTFGESVSGFGLDFLLGKSLAKSDGSNIAIIDDLVVDHLKPIDDAEGGYYAYLRSRHINPKAELWRLAEKFELDLSIHQHI